MQQQDQRGMPGPAVYLIGGVSVDLTPVVDSREDQAKKAAALKAAYDAVASFVNAIGLDSGLATLRLASGYSYDPELRCYHAMFRPDYRMRPSVIHRSFGYGQVVAMRIPDIRECKYFKDNIPDVKVIADELRWACLNKAADAETKRDDPIDSIAKVGLPVDVKSWTARLTGPNSFVGLYHHAGDSVDAPVPGLLVIYSSSLYNQEANYVKLIKTSGTMAPTYLAFATDPHQAKLRNLQVRNALRMTHDAMVALGFGNEIATKTIEDSEAVRRPDGKSGAQLPPASDDRKAIIDAIRPVPQIVNPDVHNELDLMLPRSDFTTGTPNSWVSYYDGVSPVSQAHGGFLALKDGNPSLGIYHMVNAQGYSLPYWDGGFCAAGGWELDRNLENRCTFYKPLVVVASDWKP